MNQYGILRIRNSTRFIMKVKEKEKARELRRQGWSINQIYKEVGVAKGSVSVWVRDIPVAPEHQKHLSERGQKKEIIEKRRSTRLFNESARRQIIINEAKSEVRYIAHKELFLIGIMLYWAEGGKKSRGSVRFSNSDPQMIKVFMRFLRELCAVTEDRFRGHIHIHSHLVVNKAEKYWSRISGIPITQFFKTYYKPSRASQGKKDSLPYGTFDVYVCDTELFLKIRGWTEGVLQRLNCQIDSS
jgi:hypothetical protein